MNLKYYLRGLGIGIAVTTMVMAFALNNNSKIELSDAEIIERAESLGMVMEDKVLVKQGSDNADTSNAETSGNKKEVVKDIEDEVAKATNVSTENAAEENTDEESKDNNANEVTAEEKAEEAAKKAAEEEKAKKEAEEAAKKAAEEEKAKKAEEEKAKKAAEEAAKKAEEEKAKKAAEEAAKKAEQESTQKAELPKNGTIIMINVKPGSGSETVSTQLYNAGLVDSAKSFNAYLCSGGYDRRLTTGDHSVPAGSTYAEIAKIMTSSKK